MRITSTLCALAIVALAGATTARADDYEIYVNQPGTTPAGGGPLVMLSLDWQPRLGSTACAGPECDFLMDEGVVSTKPTNFFELLRAVLKKVLQSISGVRVGLMVSNDQGTGKSCSGPQVGHKPCTNGGYILKGFVPVDSQTQMYDLSNPDSFFSRLDAMPIPQERQSHQYQGAELFFEFFRYLTGQGVYNGHNGWTDWDTDSAHNVNDSGDLSPNDVAQLSWDQSIEHPAGQYIAPTIEQCSRIYTINIMFNVAQQEDDSASAIKATKAHGGMAGISLRPPFEPPGAFGRVIKYLNDVDLADGTFGAQDDIDGTQNVTSYFIVDSTKINNKTNGYAKAGGTGTALVLSGDPHKLIDTLTNIFDQILSVSTTFVAPSVPVNVFNRVDVVPEVYIALFKPDDDGKPWWNGDLKKLRINHDDAGGLSVVDTGNLPAVDTDGRIIKSALTLWTNPDAVPAPDTDETDFTAGHDGRAVDVGGTGSRIPGFTVDGTGNTGATNNDTATTKPRRLFTEVAADSDLINLDADDTTAARLLIDNRKLLRAVMKNAECGGTCTTYAALNTSRKTTATRRVVGLVAFARDPDEGRYHWLMGDPMHSRPLVVNYGARTGYSKSNPDIRIFLGTNGGILHSVLNTNPDGSQSGEEVWGFMPSAVTPVLEQLKTNALGGTPYKPYMIDGTPSGAVFDLNNDGTLNGNDKVWLFVGLRRGGKGLYALDVTDPDNPKLMWTIQKTSGGDFDELGQTWSTPQVRLIQVDRGHTDANSNPIADIRPVLIFGGGYHGDDYDGSNIGKDARPPQPANPALPTQTELAAIINYTGSNDDEGNALYIVDAETGHLIWKAAKGTSNDIYDATTKTYTRVDLVDSIPSEVSAADSDGGGQGLADRGYVGDSGGTVWRLNLPDADRGHWKFTPLFKGGRHYHADRANDRRFFHRPAVVLSKDTIGDFDGVVIASGNRPDPKDTAVHDYLYLIKDRKTGLNDPPPDTLTQSDLADLTDPGITAADAANIANGWEIELEVCSNGSAGANCGEKGLAPPLVIGNTILVNTYIPASETPLPVSNTVPACAPAAGSGVQYALDLQTGGAVFDLNTSVAGKERFGFLKSGGIPAESVPIGIGPDGSTIVLNPDLTFKTLPGQGLVKTFWFDRKFPK